MKKLIHVLLICFTLVIILSGNTPFDKTVEKEVPARYINLIKYSRRLSPEKKAMVDYFIKLDIITNARRSYIEMMTANSKP
jgi:hypothetical protein